MNWSEVAGAIAVTLLLITLLMVVIAVGVFLISVIFEVPRYEFRNWADRKRLDRAVRRAKTPGDVEDAQAARDSWRPRTKNEVWK